MSLREIINNKLKAAMLAKKKRDISTLRLINAAIKDRDIEARTGGEDQGVGDDIILGILSKMIKQRKESSEIYKESNRLDLSQQEDEEIVIISKFLPEQLSEKEISRICQEIVRKTNSSSIKDMGLCMSELKNNYSSQVDFSIAGKVLKELLI
ncbi:MAG: GatB/YqeY domain-containing protein [Alphaproteobacteria bacterium]|jgi:uncharacterized protein YqeY|tara:strand:- start:9078 stop:9536 length:459 start_codon:yes stop_codon:yes gene_type:complete